MVDFSKHHKSDQGGVYAMVVIVHTRKKNVQNTQPNKTKPARATFIELIAFIHGGNLQIFFGDAITFAVVVVGGVLNITFRHDHNASAKKQQRNNRKKAQQSSKRLSGQWYLVCGIAKMLKINWAHVVCMCMCALDIELNQFYIKAQLHVSSVVRLFAFFPAQSSNL